MKVDKVRSHDGAVIFDLDGTLVDTSGDIVFSINYIRKFLGQTELDKKTILEAVGHGAPFLLERITGISRDDERIKDVLAEFRRHYLEHQTEHSKLYSGILDTLGHFSQRFDLFVLSNKPHPAVLAELKGQGIESFFKNIWGGGGLDRMKPDPIGIETAIEDGGYSRDRVIMVGDMAVDIETAANAGVKSCFVTWGFGELLSGAPEPDVIIDEVSDLVPAVDRLIESGEKY